MLDVGDKVPDFTLSLAYADGRRDPVAFRSLLGRGPIVMSFFPLAFTRTCTAQMCDMSDRAPEFEGLRAQAFGFSCDTPFVNVNYAKAHHLRHGIFSDPNRDVVGDLWATQEVVGVRNVARRGWMVVAPDGRVAAQRLIEAGEGWPGNDAIRDALQKVAP